MKKPIKTMSQKPTKAKKRKSSAFNEGASAGLTGAQETKLKNSLIGKLDAKPVLSQGKKYLVMMSGVLDDISLQQRIECFVKNESATTSELFAVLQQVGCFFADKKFDSYIEHKHTAKSEFKQTVMRKIELKQFFYQDLLKFAVLSLYGRVPDHYYEFALSAAEAGLSKEKFNECLKIMKKVPKIQDYIPNVEIDGAMIGQPGFQLTKLAFDDPDQFILGHYTSWCQSINGASRSCVLHGATSPFGGFYALKKHDKFVAQCWVGLTENNELVFDSIEHNVGYDKKIIMQMFELAATDICDRHPHIQRVLFGGGGNTPTTHGYKATSGPFSRIIGYKNVGYDSKTTRFCLVDHEGLKPEALALVRANRKTDIDAEYPKDIVLGKGIDTYVHKGHSQKDLMFTGYQQTAFRLHHPRVTEKLLANKKNPLIEFGFRAERENKTRERIGELFITGELSRDLLEDKFFSPETSHKYNVDHFVYINNDESALIKVLRELNLAEGGNCLIEYTEGVHAYGAYIEKQHGQVYAYLFDPEELCNRYDDIFRGIEEAIPGVQIVVNTAKLQRDFYSCTTLTQKFLTFMAKEGRKIWGRILKNEYLEDQGGYFHLKVEHTPPELLKMSQYPLEKLGLPEEAWEYRVSHKKDLNLTNYYGFYCKELHGKRYNTAALRSKYHTLHKAEEMLQRKMQAEEEMASEDENSEEMEVTDGMDGLCIVS